MKRREQVNIWLVCMLLGAAVSLTMSAPPAPSTTTPTTTSPPTTQGPTTTSPPTNPTTSSSTTTIKPPQPPPSPPNSDGSECLLSKSSDNEKELLKRVNKMKGKEYFWKDNEHSYYFSICQTAKNATDKSAGFIQLNTVQNKMFVLGRLNDVDLEGVENIIRMSYNNGDNYANACNRTQRNAVVYLVCDPNQGEDVFQMIEENNAKDTNCAYIFELKTKSICSNDTNNNTTTTTTTATTKSSTTPSSSTVSSTSSPNNNNNKTSSKIGIFSIIMISLSSIFVVYMMIGTIYLRFVNQARGWEQIPHMNLWQAVGGRFADCCNYVCRCGQRQTEVHSYENINDRISDDENLLNM